MELATHPKISKRRLIYAERKLKKFKVIATYT